MSLFQSKISKFEEKIESLQTELEAVRTVNEDLTTELETLRSNQIAHDETVANLEAEKVQAIADLATANESIDSLTEQLKEAETNKEAFELEVSKEAAKTVADLGIDPVEEIPEGEESDGGEDLLATFKSLDGKALAEFFEANKDKLFN